MATRPKKRKRKYTENNNDINIHDNVIFRRHFFSYSQFTYMHTRTYTRSIEVISVVLSGALAKVVVSRSFFFFFSLFFCSLRLDFWCDCGSNTDINISYNEISLL